ncbi:hypothetical protein VKI21_06925 [Cyanobacterium aponinum UTEX 3222]|uniref:hypothetical protein n=1 Tax=Cyanobacterium aponinum TaxID=379064 RepID=UPI003093AED4|nr:hypothetical protein VKI21_06925 [Cyanobacterium aponinum UTEX 3222]
MGTVTDNDLKELKELISDLAKTQKEGFNQLNEKMNNMRVEMATVKENLSSLNKQLTTVETNVTKRIDGIDTRLNTLIAVTFTALLGIIGKIVFFK